MKTYPNRNADFKQRANAVATLTGNKGKQASNSLNHNIVYINNIFYVAYTEVEFNNLLLNENGDSLGGFFKNFKFLGSLNGYKIFILRMYAEANSATIQLKRAA